MMRFLHMLASIEKASNAAREAQRRIDIHDEKLLLLQQQRALNESRIGRENNTLVLQDLEIEKRILEVKKLQMEIDDLTERRDNLSRGWDPIDPPFPAGTPLPGGNPLPLLPGALLPLSPISPGTSASLEPITRPRNPIPPWQADPAQPPQSARARRGKKKRR